jgi:DNA mismatch repair protein MSH4
MTSKILNELIIKIRGYLMCLLKISESIGLLDLLLCFVNLIINNNDYVRPELTIDGPIAIKSCRHPILDKNKSNNSSFIPNDVYSSISNNFQIITGPNMSGKTTYLKQIGVISILAHIGSFIPAKFGSFRVKIKYKPGY